MRPGQSATQQRQPAAELKPPCALPYITSVTNSIEPGMSDTLSRSSEFMITKPPPQTSVVQRIKQDKYVQGFTEKKDEESSP